MPPVPPPPARRLLGRWLIAIFGLGLVILLLLAALPGLIGGRFARDKILGRINQALAPGRLDVDRFEVSWTGPTRLPGLKLFAPDGARVVEAPVVEIQRSLAQILFGQGGASVVVLDHATLAIRRHGDGKVDLVEALRSVVDQPNPRRDVSIQVKSGSLELRSDGSADPFVARIANFDLRIPPSPQSTTWTLKLGHDGGGELVAQGDSNRWTARDQNPSLADLRLDLEAKRWPIDVRTEGLASRGQLDGSLKLSRHERWNLEGNARISDGNLTGTRLAGDTLDPGPVTSSWSLAQTPEGWSVERFSVDSTIGSLHAEGKLDAGLGFVSDPKGLGLTGQVDLAAVARQLPHALSLRPGLVVESGSVQMTAQPSGKDQSPWSIALKVTDLEARDGERRLTLRDPASLSAEVVQNDQAVTINKISLQAPFVTLTGAATIEQPTNARRFSFLGQISPDYEAISTWLGDQVEPGARIAGQPRSVRAQGHLSGSDALESIDAEFGLDLLGVDIYGMKLGPTPIVVRAKGGQFSIDPIKTTLNEGQVRLEPELILSASKNDPMLRLGKNSTIRDARINDAVSRRVLAFVAPVLEGATRASGRVSVDLDRAEFPLTSGRSQSAQVEGLVVFNDVAFAPGPLANDLLGMINRRDASLKLDRPVNLTIADGRINQSGLALPIGDLTRIELAGWVDFDRNLALTATLPVTPAMLGNNPFLADIAAGTEVRLPIGGTLSQPKIDRDAFTASLKELGKSLLTRGATRGALELLMRANRPKDPNAPPSPPPPTASERKALRQERRAERKANREVPPQVMPDP